MTIGGLAFRVKLKNAPSLIEGYQVFMSDRKSVNSFHKELFYMDGAELKLSKAELGYKLYTLKIHKEKYLENNNRYLCKNYEFDHEYHEVSRVIPVFF